MATASRKYGPQSHVRQGQTGHPAFIPGQEMSTFSWSTERSAENLVKICTLVADLLAMTLTVRSSASYIRGTFTLTVNNLALDVELYVFLQAIGKENRLFIRYLRISMMNYMANVGVQLGGTFELLARGHNLRQLTLNFGNEGHLHCFVTGAEKLMTKFLKLNGIGKLETIATGYPDDRVGWGYESERELSDLSQKHIATLVMSAESPRPSAEAPQAANPPSVERARLLSARISDLLESRDLLTARQRTVKEELLTHEEKAKEAAANLEALDSEVQQLEADIDAFILKNCEL